LTPAVQYCTSSLEHCRRLDDGVERSHVMSRTFKASLLSVMAGLPAAVLAQQPVPLQRGVSVQMPVTRNAVAVPAADAQDALVVALTADGNVYLRTDRLPTSALADRVRTAFSTRSDKTLYIKADARVPYARLVEVIDALQTSGVDGLTLLTAQQDVADQKSGPVPPKGLEFLKKG
jgi:biopolymer transport protein ExbD